MNTSKKYTPIATLEHGRTIFEIMQIDNLDGASSPVMAQALFFAKQQGLHIRMVRIQLNDSTIKTEAGALYWYKGQIQAETDVKGVGSFLKKSIQGKLTSESLAKPQYSGRGEIWLEPSFKHYLMIPLNGASIIVDKGMFYAATGDVEIKPSIQKSVSAAVMGNEGFFQMEISGDGIVVLESEVPESEISQISLQPGEILKVDGNFAVLRTKGVKFTVTNSNKGLISSGISGEGFLNTFEGPGEVWLAPTLPLYRRLEFGQAITNKNRGNNA